MRIHACRVQRKPAIGTNIQEEKKKWVEKKEEDGQMWASTDLHGTIALVL
jgi:hypothetical protein